MAEIAPNTQLLRKITRASSGFGNLQNYSYIERRMAARAFLSGGHARILPLEVDVRGYGMGANRAMCLALGVVFYE